MSLRKSKVFRVVGFGLCGLAVFSALFRVAQRALSGDWNASYHSAKLIHWTYGGAFIVMCFAAVVALVGLFFYLRRRYGRRDGGA